MLANVKPGFGSEQASGTGLAPLGNQGRAAQRCAVGRPGPGRFRTPSPDLRAQGLSGLELIPNRARAVAPVDRRRSRPPRLSQRPADSTNSRAAVRPVMRTFFTALLLLVPPSSAGPDSLPQAWNVDHQAVADGARTGAAFPAG